MQNTTEPSTGRRLGLPRSRMLKSSARITELFQQGIRRHGRYLTVYAMPATPAKVAFVIPRKYGKAHERNQQKRRLREIYRQHPDWIPEDQDLVILIRARQGLADYQQFLDDLRTVLRRIRRAIAAKESSR